VSQYCPGYRHSAPLGLVVSYMHSGYRHSAPLGLGFQVGILFYRHCAPLGLVCIPATDVVLRSGECSRGASCL
jgi:hypothetical protein